MKFQSEHFQFAGAVIYMPLPAPERFFGLKRSRCLGDSYPVRPRAMGASISAGSGVSRTQTAD